MTPDEAMDTFYLATDEKYRDPGNLPKFYNELEAIDPIELAQSEEACVQFTEYM